MGAEKAAVNALQSWDTPRHPPNAFAQASSGLRAHKCTICKLRKELELLIIEEEATVAKNSFQDQAL